MVDTVGGVEVYVPFHMRYDDPYQDLHIDIAAGLQVLDGQDALRFARYRTGNDRRYTISDYQRIEHQQQIIASVVQDLMTPRTILRIPEFIGIFNSYVDSDLSHGELLWFANQGRDRLFGSDDDALSFYTIPMLGTSGPPNWYELADEAGILELVNRTVNPFVSDLAAYYLRIAS
jgi:anionic cell wall polymer biosynthesis LytR-Cps2A-Psr (LCP) family protein